MNKYENTKIFKLFYGDKSYIGYTLCNLAQKKYLLKKTKLGKEIFEKAKEAGEKVNIILLETKSFDNIEEAKGYVHKLRENM